MFLKSHTGIIGIVCLLFSSLLTSNASAQDLLLLDLNGNEQLVKYHQQWQEQQQLRVNVNAQGDTLKIPFLDDFSYAGFYPDSKKWINRKVFVNPNMALAPPTLGVATFDGLDSTGYPYNFASPSNSTAKADVLTSRPFNLATDTLGLPLSVADSLVFSFYIQPQGLGNAPEKVDSFLVDFYNPVSQAWTKVYATIGKSLPSGDSSFTYVAIKLTNPDYFTPGFRFRFRNYATLSGNVDHWHLDYVYLHKNRSVLDTSLAEVSFVYPAKSLLKDYQAMPYSHYSAANMTGNAQTAIRNDFPALVNTDYTLDVISPIGAKTNLVTASYNILPYTGKGFSECDLSNCNLPAPPFSYAYPVGTLDSITFVVQHAIRPNIINNKSKLNDTTRFNQTFLNYYAYDDGSAESALGLNQPFGQLAMKFSTPVTDTLQAIDVYFNPFVTNVAGQAFRFVVYADASGKPGKELYRDSVVFPIYTRGYNGFTRYLLADSTFSVGGNFYVGMVQNSAEPLNVGFDRNNNHQSKIAYNVTGSWTTSVYPGSLMIRPVFGSRSKLVGIVEQEGLQSLQVHMYPNPAQDVVRIGLQDFYSNSTFALRIMDVTGRLVHEQLISGSQTLLTVQDYPAGIYLVQLIDNLTKHSQVVKLVVQH